MKYQSLLFDLDGTLVESGPGIVNSIKVAFEKMNLPLPTEEELQTFIGPPSRTVFPKFGIPEDQVETAVGYYRARYWEKGKYECRVYDGIPELLQTLKDKGYRLYVATSKPEETAVTMLNHLHLAEYFDEIAGATFDHTREKKSQVITYLLEKVSADNAVMIGDTLFDVIGANEMNLPSIGVTWGYGNLDEMLEHGVAAIAHSTEELEALL